ncbi:MAG: stage III sporulation protein AD [Oscillospiraceae bacterium]|nr:stage III sporulation protein AD [Oscillospiraceae bacterium]
MIDDLLKLSAMAVISCLLILTVKKQAPELGLILSLCACALGAGFLLETLRPVLLLAGSLAEKAGLEPELRAPLWKCLGLGLLTELSAGLCADAGESALAKLVELGGGILCLAVSLPLLQAVLALIEGLL